MKGIYLSDFEALSQTDELQMLYKLRYETHPNYRESISNIEVSRGTQQLIKKIKFHFLKYKTILPLNDESDFSAYYNISLDPNYMAFWSYFLNRRNHRRHKQLVRSSVMTKSMIIKSGSINPIVRNTQKIQT